MGTLSGVKYEKVSYEKGGLVATGFALFHPSDILIASSFHGERVIAVGIRAFADKKLFFKSVHIESGITTIHDSAFVDCDGLKSVILPRSVTTIGKSAFWRCTGIKSFDIPSSVVSIGENAFQWCEFKTVFIPKSVTKIGKNAFQTSVLSKLTIYCESETQPVGWEKEWNGSNKVYWGAKYANDQNASENQIEKSIKQKIEAGVPSSRGLAFTLHKDGKGYIVSGIGTCHDKIVSIPDTNEGKPVTSIAKSAFKGNKSIKGLVIPGTIKYFGDRAFYGCDSLEAVSMGDGLRVIGDGAFTGCRALTSVAIPETVNKIGVWAFKDCESLENMIISASVSYVGASAFEGCRLLSLECDHSDAPASWDEGWNPDNRPAIWMAKRGKRVL